MTKTIMTLLAALLLFSCSDESNKVSEDKFVGLWEIKGRSMLDGIQIKIDKENNTLVGRIIRLNDNKYVKLFADSNDIWVSDIKRTSNYEFKLTENKIAMDLFALYGQTTSQVFKVQFIDDNTIGLANENSDPKTTTNYYKRK